MINAATPSTAYATLPKAAVDNAGLQAHTMFFSDINEEKWEKLNV